MTGSGNRLLMISGAQTWTKWFLNGARASDDFMTERDDFPPEEREPLCLLCEAGFERVEIKPPRPP
ncbi:MAG: antitoxin [Alphaproteobacteria bacterium]